MFVRACVCVCERSFTRLPQTFPGSASIALAHSSLRAQVSKKVFAYLGGTVPNSTLETYTPHECMMRQLYTMNLIADNNTESTVDVSCWEVPGTNMECCLLYTSPSPRD